MKANVILFSYNRPKMIRQAIDSIYNGVYQNFSIWMLDDGSDFDIYELEEEYDDRLLVCDAGKISLEERFTNLHRFVDNVNYVVNIIPPGQFIVYLCDDDVLGKNWLDCLAEGFSDTYSHVIRGEQYFFSDYQNPWVEGRKGKINSWNLGNWGIKSDCFSDCNVKWEYWEKGEKVYAPHSYDVKYINKVWGHNITYIDTDVPALYRREHMNAVSKRMKVFNDDGTINPEAEFRIEHIGGMME